MQQVRIGIIGAGNRGKGLGRGFASLDGVSITAVCDPSRERREALGALLDLPAGQLHARHGELLAREDLDAVFVATPDHTHYEVVLDAARAGKHILCEKPMALSLDHCRQMQAAAREAGIVFMLGFCLRYNRLYQEAKALVAAGEIGRVRLVTATDSVERGGAYFFHDWHRLKAKTGGLLLQKATHSLDIVNWLLEDVPRSVYARGDLAVFGGNEANDKRCATCERAGTCPEYLNAESYLSDFLEEGDSLVAEDLCAFAREIDVNDTSQLLVEYAGGASLAFTECHFTPDYKREFTFIGDAGRLEILDFYHYNANPDVAPPRHHLRLAKRHSDEIRTLVPELRKGGHGGGDPALLEDFVAAVRGERKPLADGRSGLLSTAIAATAETSIESGRVEPVELGAEG